MKYFLLQVPDAKSGKDNVDTVLVDEEAVGAPDAPGCGAKLLSSNHGLEEIPKETESRETSVSSLISTSAIDLCCSDFRRSWMGYSFTFSTSCFNLSVIICLYNGLMINMYLYDHHKLDFNRNHFLRMQNSMLPLGILPTTRGFHI